MDINVSMLDIGFVALLAITGLLRMAVPQRGYVFFGVASSGILLGVAAPGTLLAICATTLLFVYPAHRIIRAAEARFDTARLTPFLLPLAVALLVVVMFVFKLYKHFSLPWMANTRLHTEILELVGFSYFIFKAVGFLHIQSVLKTTSPNPWSLLFFTLFPPTLTSGPIQKFQDFQTQVRNPAPLTTDLACRAVYRITRGYFRKIVLAGLFQYISDTLLNVTASHALLTVAVIASLYLFFYFDFAGYSDIAIGFGLLLGIRVPENFKKPFLSTTVSEFWRNWHITLADWFRDHVFIPFGGMRTSRLGAGLLAFGIMVLCGLWHGLTVSFVAWGVWHGFILLTEAISGSTPISPANRHGPYYWLRLLWTNSRVAFGAIFFLPFDTTTRLLPGLMHWNLSPLLTT